MAEPVLLVESESLLLGCSIGNRYLPEAWADRPDSLNDARQYGDAAGEGQRGCQLSISMMIAINLQANSLIEFRDGAAPRPLRRNQLNCHYQARGEF